MKYIVNKLSLATALVAGGFLAACGGGGSDGPATGSLKVSMTDAPACGFDQVNVTVAKVRVHQSENASETANGWSEIVLAAPKKINLLDLTNGVLAELGQPITLPAGRYTQVRLLLDSTPGANTVVLSGSGSEETLATPSALTSGIKLVNSFEVAQGQQTDLVLDFDACKSIVKKGNGNGNGNGGGYALKPVIKIIPATLNGIEGYIEKATLAATANVMVTAQQNGNIVSATTPDPATGRFLLSRLPTGEYDVVITADDRATTVVSKVPVASTSSIVAVSTGVAPITPANSVARSISGAITLNPASTADTLASYATAIQSFSSGPKITVKHQGAEVPSGSYALNKLPVAAPMVGQYSATLPISFAAQTPTQGAGKYAVEYTVDGYQSQTITIDVTSTNAVSNVTLVK